MAIGWISVLQMVPWSDVIRNAPKVAEGAKKLWKAVGKKPALDEVLSPSHAVALSSDAQALAVLQVRVDAAEDAISALHEQMLASSELIATLAEQNTQLIVRVERNRLQLAWLTGALLLVAVVAVASLVILLRR